MQRLTLAFSAYACLTMFLAGCGGDSPDYPDTIPVTGKVTLDGKPVENASITLTPANKGEATRGARATSAADGTFTVKTFFSASYDADGAVPGKYLVSVTKYEQKAPSSHGEALQTMEGQSNQSKMQRAMAMGGENVLPEKYASPESSGLEIEVKAGQEKTLNLELESE